MEHDARIMQPNPWLIGTSLTFLIPLGYTLLDQRTLVLASTLWFVVIASTLYHATKDPILFWVDQLSVLALFLSSVCFGLNQTGAPRLIVIIVVAGCTVLYYGGWWFDTLVWSKNYITATASHAAMHLWVIGGVLLAAAAAAGTPVV